MRIKPLDTLLAIKVINLTPGLVPSDRLVAATLIEHFNRRTGRCDPGIERIADLLGICTRTVMRSTRRLQVAGLFKKDRHGGYSNRNSYAPNWTRFAELELAWRSKMQESSRSRRTEMSPEIGHPSHVAGDISVTQTCSSNRFNKTYSNGHPKEEECKTAIAKPSAVDDRTAAAPARIEAERRWSNDLHRAFSALPVTYAEIIEAIDEAIRSTATEAELRSRGGGLRFICDRLRLRAAR
jgi:hypothetical protein